METKELLEAAKTIEVMKSLFEAKPNAWVPVIAAVGGALVGGVVSIIPTWWIERNKRDFERKSVTSALTAEIKALLCVIEHRQYVKQMKFALEQLKLSPGAKYKYQVKVPEHYSRVYQAHIEKLGIVDSSLSAQIVQFHHLLDSIIQDVSPGGIIADIGGDEESFKRLIALAESALTLGREITNP